MGAFVLAIVVAVIVVAGLLLLLVRRHIAQADRREFGSGDSGRAMLVSDPDTASDVACGGFDAAGGDSGGGDGGGGGD